MNKKTSIIVFGVLALFIIGGVTYAAFVQNSTAKSTSIVAKWRFKANNSKETFTIDLAKNASNLLNDKIGPGSNGSFDIELDGTGSQVNIDYSVTFANLENIPDNMKFYSDNTKKVSVNLASYKLSGTLNYGDKMKKTYTIYWEWPINGSNDTAYAGKTLKFDVLVDAVQKTN